MKNIEFELRSKEQPTVIWLKYSFKELEAIQEELASSTFDIIIINPSPNYVGLPWIEKTRN